MGRDIPVANMKAVASNLMNGRITYEEVGLDYIELISMLPDGTGEGAHVLLQRRYNEECALREWYKNAPIEQISSDLQEAIERQKYLVAYRWAIACENRVDFSKLKAEVPVDKLGEFIKSVKAVYDTTMTVRNKNHPCYKLLIASEEIRKFDSVPSDKRKRENDDAIRKQNLKVSYLQRVLKIRKNLSSIKERIGQDGSPINVLEVGEAIGAKKDKTNLFGGRVMEFLHWNIPTLRQIGEAVKTVSPEEGPIELSGNIPTYVLSVISHALQGREITTISPRGKKMIIPNLEQGESEEEYVKFNVTENGKNVLIEYTIDDEYEDSRASAVKVPKVADGRCVYIKGNGPSTFTVAMANAYSGNSASVAVRQIDQGYICTISKDEEMKVGYITRDPIGGGKIAKRTPNVEKSR